MKYIITTILLLITISIKSFSQDSNKSELIMNTKIATFGSGCFWCSEAIFSRIEGVIKVEPGFCGGETKKPTYKEVVGGTTGHAEVAQITYDPNIVSFNTLLEVFWKTHNPTTLNRQGGDVGTQYRSVIFYQSEEQKKTATHYLEELEKAKIWKNPIVTEISPFISFYPAEKHHQDYYKNNPAQAYCNYVITPKIKKFEKIFSEKLK